MAFENVDYNWFFDLPTIEDQITAVEATFAKLRKGWPTPLANSARALPLFQRIVDNSHGKTPPEVFDHIVASAGVLRACENLDDVLATCAWELEAGHRRAVRQWIMDMDLNVQAHVYQNTGSRVRSLVLLVWERAFEARHGVDAFDEMTDTLTQKWDEMIDNGATVEDANASYAAALLSGIRS